MQKTTHAPLTLTLTLLILPPLIFFTATPFLKGSYLLSLIYKLVFLTPLLYRTLAQHQTIKQALTHHTSLTQLKHHWKAAIGFGTLFLTTYLIAFTLYATTHDLTTIKEHLHATIGLTKTNIILIGLFIITLNSLLEEYFWRGFIYDELKHTTNQPTAHTISALAFSIHHIMFYATWFTLPYFLLTTAGLIIFAFIANHLYDRGGILTSWTAHALADIAQITAALIILT